MSARANGDDLATHQGDSPARTVTSNRLADPPLSENATSEHGTPRTGCCSNARTGCCSSARQLCRRRPAVSPVICEPCAARDHRQCARNGAHASIRKDSHADRFIITDDGPGPNPKDVPRLFAVNRPLVSSKLLAAVLRRAVAAFVGALAIRPGFDHERDVGAVLRGDTGVASVMAGGVCLRSDHAELCRRHRLCALLQLMEHQAGGVFARERAGDALIVSRQSRATVVLVGVTCCMSWCRSRGEYHQGEE